jgi:hypothetical protein
VSRDRVEERERSATVFSDPGKGRDFVTEKQLTKRAGEECQEGKLSLYGQKNEFFVFSLHWGLRGKTKRRDVTQ